MKVNFSITNDNGSPILDRVTGQPHAFSFPVATDVLAVIEAWMAKVGSTDADGNFTPKYPNAAEVAREILFDAFQRMIPAEALAAFDSPVKQAEQAKKAFLWGLFGQTPPAE